MATDKPDLELLRASAASWPVSKRNCPGNSPPTVCYVDPVGPTHRRV